MRCILSTRTPVLKNILKPYLNGYADERNSLTAISPVDGRYDNKTEPLRAIFSEDGLIKYRGIVEIHRLQKISEMTAIQEVPELSVECQAETDRNRFSIVPDEFF